MGDSSSVQISTPAPLSVIRSSDGQEYHFDRHSDEPWYTTYIEDAKWGSGGDEVLEIIDWLDKNNYPYQAYDGGHYNWAETVTWKIDGDDHGENLMIGIDEPVVTRHCYEEGKADWVFGQPNRWREACESWTPPANFNPFPTIDKE